MDADVALDSYATEIKSLEASLMHFRNLKHVVYDDEPEKKYDKVTQQTCVYRHPRYSLAFERFFRLLVALEQSALGAMNSLRCGALFLFGFNFTIEHLRGGTLQDVRPFKGLVELAAGFRSYNVLPSKPERFKKAFYYLAALTHGIERLSLVLDIGNEPCPELQNEPWLSTTIWPALKFLHLHEGSLDEVVLHELLQSRATTLRHLTLEDMDLRDVESLSLYSGWVYTFGFIRRTLALDTFNILGKLSEARMRVWYAQPARERLEEKPHGIWTARSIELYVSRKADIDLFRPVLSEGKLLGWAVEEDSSWCDVSNADVPLIYGGSSIPRCEASSGHLYC
ncbi:MAG: hypothetical protein M1828_002739 [Chrysothrix sp. TS-e1954]|nr:MAG: hypothetical protein M1828_002739 [Chrysothrix sp. TS-e1954]